MKLFKLLIIGASLLYAQFMSAGNAEYTTFTRPGILSYNYHSDTLGRGFVIDVLLPPTFNPAQSDKYPVIYMTDGFLHFPMVGPNLLMEQALYEEGLGKIAPAILVGISYPFDNSDSSLRFTDLTPTAADFNGVMLGGGADRFAEFIETELKPFINTSFHGDPNNETFMGHSLGGLFGLHVMFNHPESYQRFVIGSPSIWWDDKQIKESEANYAAQNDDLNAKLYLFIGSEENCRNVTNEVCGVKDLKKMYQKLKSRHYPNLKIEREILKNENHGTVVSPGYDKGLRKVFNQ